MPDREYYLLNKAEQERVRKAYIEHMERLLKLARFSVREIETMRRAVLTIETALAKASMRKEDLRDPEKIYHKLTISALQKVSPAIDWTSYFMGIRTPKIKEIIVGQPEFFKVLSRLLKNRPLSEWKLYLEWHLINDTAGMLSDPFVKENFSFYGKVLTGAKKMRPLWRRALATVNSGVGEELGKAYVQKYYPPKAKKAMDALVSDLFSVYASRIKHLDWMSTSTKQKALQKLNAMRRKIGHPTKWISFKQLALNSNDYVGNLMRINEFWHARDMRKLGKPVDRSEWFMTLQTVNAYFSPSLNEIVFPAAILQWPFFDAQADAAINYAGIGSVIGHEMTHGFDDQGAKFDGKGNMRHWWTRSDKKRFDKKSSGLVEQFNLYDAAPGVKVNGQLTLGENIADLGGLAIAWDAYQKYLAKHGRKIIQGFTPEERFFLGFAQMERELARPEFTKTHALTDPHSPAPYRINGPLSNFQPFYKTFDLKKNHRLFRDSKKRAEIW